MFYPFHKNRDTRNRSNPNIVITSARNLYVRGTNIPAFVRTSSYRFTIPTWDTYFNMILTPTIMARASSSAPAGLPYHFALEYLGKDYFVFNGLPEHSQSFFLRQLADARIIPRKYEDAILIIITEDLRKIRLEKRAVEVLSHKVLTPLTIRNNSTIDNVIFLDDIISWDNFPLRIGKALLHFEIEPSIVFNEQRKIKEIQQDTRERASIVSTY